MTFCDAPGASIVVATGSGLLAGAAAVAAGFGITGTVALAGGLALAGELLVHAAPAGDEPPATVSADD